MSQELSNKAMLVRLPISQWTGRKLDRKVTRKVADDYGTAEERGRFNKLLVPKDSLDPIVKAAGAAKNYLYSQTLPWQDDGARILPAANFFDFSKEMRGHRQAFEDAVAVFLDKYPSLVESARWELKEMFDPQDYPDVWRLQRAFSFEVKVDPIPSAADFRVDLQADEVARIQADIEARGAAATEIAMRDLWDRLHLVVSRMAERLADPDNKFKDSLVNNITDLVDLLPRMNLTADPQLEAMRQEVALKLTRHDPQTLRDDKEIRQQTHKAAEDILSLMAGYCQEATA